MMKRSKLSATALIASLAMAGSVAMAQNPGFEELDRDEDGYISGSEAMALPCLAQAYRQIDKEDDRGLNRSEYEAAVQKHCQSSQQGSPDEDWPAS
ncbi:hypothetical protein [Wenzhouxiangella sp. EGI_FJ10409]|uniref:hypothetical protein n=1 Tax=Wenzhouxiangella sp. EGI_FJ10409 TaxID=3243767 RepID=UPI0035E3891E